MKHQQQPIHARATILISSEAVGRACISSQRVF